MYDLEPPKDDGLVIAEGIGEWSLDKHRFLWRYLDAFTTAMAKKPRNGLHYIDLFAGSGIEQMKNSDQLEWGSPLLAAQTPRPFSRLHLCENTKRKYEAL